MGDMIFIIYLMPFILTIETTDENVYKNADQ